MLRKIFAVIFLSFCHTTLLCANVVPGVYASEADIPPLIRALMGSRSMPAGRSAPPRQNNPIQVQQAAVLPIQPAWQDYTFLDKSQYIGYLKDAVSGRREDCLDRYNKYNDFFRHDSTLSGSITERVGGPASGRMDTVCEFLGYAHWCFALGFAYAVRDLDDPARSNSGNKCFTYQEFCTNRNKALDSTRIDDYLSRIIDEITFYHTSIKNTAKNTVATTTETRSGGSVVTSTSWRVYDTDSWVREQVGAAEMTRMLCR